MDPTSVDDTPSTLVTAAVIYYAKEMVYIHSECGVVALHGGGLAMGGHSLCLAPSCMKMHGCIMKLRYRYYLKSL